MKLLATEIKEENKILRKKSENVSEKEIKEKKFNQTIQEMLDFIKEQPDGAALAAPQIGVLKNFFIINPIILKKENESLPLDKDCIFINPKIIKISKKKVKSDEGCFSVRWYYGDVQRAEKITIAYLDLDGQKKQRGASGFLAIVFQHEIDHLFGTVFIDKAKNLQKLSKEEIEEIKNQQKKMKLQKNKKH